MRISDWSSDVCSSDLQGLLVEGVEPFAGQFLVQIGAPPREGVADVLEEQQRQDQELVLRHVHRQGSAVPQRLRPEDRKRVVKGKSVSVRVCIGGSRRIKKKKDNVDEGR